MILDRYQDNPRKYQDDLPQVSGEFIILDIRRYHDFGYQEND